MTGDTPLPLTEEETLGAFDLPSREELQAARRVQERVRETARAISGDTLSALSWGAFHDIMRLLTPQQYGGKFEQFFINFYDWESVSSTEGRGDAIDKKGRYWEIKTSCVTATRGRVNFVQIRPHHDVHGYKLFVIDDTGAVTLFELTKKQMQYELDLIGGLAHGCEEDVSSNGHPEFAIRFNMVESDDTYNRWMTRYRSTAEVPS